MKTSEWLWFVSFVSRTAPCEAHFRCDRNMSSFGLGYGKTDFFVSIGNGSRLDGLLTSYYVGDESDWCMLRWTGSVLSINYLLCDVPLKRALKTYFHERTHLLICRLGLPFGVRRCLGEYEEWLCEFIGFVFSSFYSWRGL